MLDDLSYLFAKICVPILELLSELIRGTFQDVSVLLDLLALDIKSFSEVLLSEVQGGIHEAGPVVGVPM
jgi:hypothetical protein